MRKGKYQKKTPEHIPWLLIVAADPYKYVCDWFTEQFPNYKTAKKAEESLKKAA